MAEEKTVNPNESLYEQELTPYQYFEEVKARKAKITDRELARIYDNCLELIEKAKKTGQKNQSMNFLYDIVSEIEPLIQRKINENQ